MTTRYAWMLGLSATLLPLAFVGDAYAQRAGNVGQQIERQFLNNLGNAVTGQPYQNSPYTPYQGPQVGYGQPGYQPQWGPGYYPQQPLQGYYPQQSFYPQRGYYTQPGYYPQQPQQGYYAPQPPQQPASAQRYQLPAQFAGTAQGTIISYGGVNYVVNADGTMSPTTAAPARPRTNTPRYQIPAQFAGTTPGSTVTYGGATYVINNDKTMSPSAGATAR